MLQWLVLRKHLARAGWWVAASLAAVAVVGGVILGVGLLDADVGWVAGMSAFGTVVGVLQWAMLKRQVHRAGWWVLASTVGWVAGMPLGDIAGPPALGAVYGVVTGTMLVWLLRHEASGSDQHQ